MTLRRVVFWSHLSVGVLVGLVVLTMSVTGVLLTYERQIVRLAERQAFSVPAREIPRLDAGELAGHAQAALGSGAVLVFANEADAPVEALRGRREKAFLDPYTGAVLGDGVPSVEAFFGVVTRLHRWFALEGEARGYGRAVTGVSNLLFLFLLVSGAFLWWPRIWRWSRLKTQLFFRRGLPGAKARDYNWHHVFGIWALVPLFAIVLSGVVISYPWASDLVYRAYGEEPARGRPGPRAAAAEGLGAAPADPVSLESVLATARQAEPDWRRITLRPPATDAATVEVTVDRGNGAQAALRRTLTISRQDGSVVAESGPEAMSPGSRARIFLRFIHTGEVYGIIGQTVAGLASIASLFLVYTGLALAYRRLIAPLLRARRRPAATGSPTAGTPR